MPRPDSAEVYRTLRRYTRWVARAKPGDYMIALGTASASVPVIGRHLELIGGLAALGVGGRHYVPGLISTMRDARTTPDRDERKRAERALMPDVLTDALTGIVAAESLAVPWPSHRASAPVLRATAQRRHIYQPSVRYGEDPRQLLDVWRAKDAPQDPPLCSSSCQAERGSSVGGNYRAMP